MAVRDDGDNQSQRLRGWKEIGRHFGVDERTAKRWEATRGLPVHRLPGEMRAPVFAYVDELAVWLSRDGSVAHDAQAGALADRDAALAIEIPDPQAMKGPPWRVLSLLVLVIGVALWFGARAIEGERVAEVRTSELTRLAAAQVSALSDQLDSPPGTVAVRAALAQEAVAVLGRVADLPGSDVGLRRDAAEGWRRLAVLQNAVDRPSLRDRAAARASLDKALALLADDREAEAADIRAMVQIEAARQAGGHAAMDSGIALLQAAKATALRDPASDLAQEWWLAEAELAGWSGNHARARDAARRVVRVDADGPLLHLRQLRARDLEAEALYYLGDLRGAQSVYAEAVGVARAGVERWPTDNRLRWGLLRQQWNLGSTLVVSGSAPMAIPLLEGALVGWEAMTRTDPSDEAVAAWVRATRLSYGQALFAAGNRSAAIPVLSQVVAERRKWLADRPDDGDRRRMLMKGLATLGDALVPIRRVAEACALYAEGEVLARQMEQDGQLTGFDRSETMRLMAEARTRSCVPEP